MFLSPPIATRLYTTQPAIHSPSSLPKQARTIPLATNPLAPRRAQPEIRSQDLQAQIHARARLSERSPSPGQNPNHEHRNPVELSTLGPRRIKLHRRIPHRSLRALASTGPVRERIG